MFIFSHGRSSLTEKWKWSWEKQLQRIENDTVPISVWRAPPNRDIW